MAAALSKSGSAVRKITLMNAMTQRYDFSRPIVLPDKIYALGFSLRKRSMLKRFVNRNDIQFIDNANSITSKSALMLWGKAAAPATLPEDVHIVRVEDGFLRSVGLGADLVQPISWVIDTRGIYFDATHESDLEVLLQTTAFDEALLKRAENLQQRIIETGITKYNVGSSAWTPAAQAKKIILVPGQVETDASIQFGALGIHRNLDLLKAVRLANPDAHILYKPHPDVVAGLRAQGKSENDATQFCDELLMDVGMAQLLENVDEVHVMTSLTGFEALLRGKRVVCYGAPFYAGWGLTEDHLQTPRRTRSLSLQALIAGALLLYPSYVSLYTQGPIDAETALEELARWRANSNESVSWWQVLYRGISRRLLRRP
jgi:capsular polysaccharide export protein